MKFIAVESLTRTVENIVLLDQKYILTFMFVRTGVLFKSEIKSYATVNCWSNI